jgi:hypothetical protein
MSAHIRWDGFDSFLREFQALPEALRTEGLAIVQEETTGAAVEITQRYGRKTGTMARRVRVEFPNSKLLVGAVVSAAPHAHLYEFGTGNRQTAKGANRGRMPAADPPVIIPIARKRRARMRRRLVELLRRHGFAIGDAE